MDKTYIDKKFEDVKAYFDQKFGTFDQKFVDMKAYFEEKFEDIDDKFLAIDVRFDAVDLRFDGIDKRLDAHDDRFDRMEKTTEFGFSSLNQSQNRTYVELSSQLDSLARSMALGLRDVSED